MYSVHQACAWQEGEGGVREQAGFTRPRLQQDGTSAGVHGRELLSPVVDDRLENAARAHHRSRAHLRQRLGVQSAGKREEKGESNTSGKQKALRTKRPSGFIRQMRGFYRAGVLFLYCKVIQ